MTARKPPCARGKSCPCICHDGFGGAHPHRRCDEGQPNVSMLPHRLGTADADSVNYTYPTGHPLHSVPIEVLKAARHVLLDAADWKDVDPGLALPIADAVVLVLLPWLDPAKVTVERCVNCDQPIRRCENADDDECVFKGWRHLDGHHSCVNATGMLGDDNVAYPKIEFVDVTQDVDDALQPIPTCQATGVHRAAGLNDTVCACILEEGHDDPHRCGNRQHYYTHEAWTFPRPAPRVPTAQRSKQLMCWMRQVPWDNGLWPSCHCVQGAGHSGPHRCAYADHTHRWPDDAVAESEPTGCAFESTTSGLRPNNVVCTCACGSGHPGAHECLQGRNHIHTTWVNPTVDTVVTSKCERVSGTRSGSSNIICNCTGAAGHTGEHACSYGRKHVHVVWTNPSAETFPSKEERR